MGHATAGTPVVVVDAFTSTPFRGNPAAVCILDGPAEESWMHDVAAEMNLSGTAFCHEAGGVWHLRWFNPGVEVDLCGHATLATSHVLATEHGVGGTIRYQSRSGLLASQVIGGDIVLDFPADPTRRAEAPDGLLAALGLPDDTPVRRGRNDYLVPVDDEATVRGLRPHVGLLRRVDCRGVIVSAPADPGARHQVVSRFFAPGAGIDEDPVTGSAHCILAPYWSARFQRDRLRYHQASARGGDLEVTRVGDRVEIVGRAVTVLRGELLH
jgi:PhzF family phenazine biosynthesis protein